MCQADKHGRFDETDRRFDDPVPHVVWSLLEQVEDLTRERDAVIATVQNADVALAATRTSLAKAETLLRRIAKYAREDRAVTPGVTRLARALNEVDQLLASTPQPAPEAGEAKAPASRWAAHCCAARLVPAFFDTREEAVEYLKAFECSPGEGHLVEHPPPPAAVKARGAGCDDCCGSGVAIDVVLGGRIERPCPYCTKRSGT